MTAHPSDIDRHIGNRPAQRPPAAGLPPDRVPEAWFNVVPHLPEPLQPPLHPATRQPVGPDDLAPLFPMALIGQEVSAEPWIDIPGEVLDVLRLWRPDPAGAGPPAGAALGTPARIYYKDESVSPAGSHKPNTAVAQAFYNQQEGIARLATETGAGQWGSALSLACAQFDLECKVYMVRSSFDQKPYRRMMIETWGGQVVPSPVDDPESPGFARLGHQRRRARRRHPGGHPLRPRLGAQPRAAAPDRHRAGGQGAAGHGRRASARRRHRLLRRRLEPGRHRPALRAGRGRAAGGGRAVVVPHAHRGPVRLRLRRHRRA